MLTKIVTIIMSLLFGRTRPTDFGFDFNGVVSFLTDYLKVDTLTSAFETLKRDLRNPFRPGNLGVWGALRHNIDLVMDLVFAFVQSLEQITVGGEELSAHEKLEIAAEALDRAVRLPWYLEPFDKPLFKLLISVAVTAMNAVQWQPIGRITTKQELAPKSKVHLPGRVKK